MVIDLTHLLSNFNLANVLIDDVECNGRHDSNGGTSGIVDSSIHGSSYNRFTDQMTSCLRDAVLGHGRQGCVGGRPEIK